MCTRLMVAVGTAIAVGITVTPAHARDGEGVGGIGRMGGIARPVGGISRPTRGMSRPSGGMSRPTPRGPARFSLPRRSTTVYRPSMPNRPATSLSRPGMTPGTNAAGPTVANALTTPPSGLDRPGNFERSASTPGHPGGGTIAGRKTLRGPQNRARASSLSRPGLGSSSGDRPLVRNGRGRAARLRSDRLGGNVGIGSANPFGPPAEAGYPADGGPAALRTRSFDNPGSLRPYDASGGGGWGGFYRRGGLSQGIW